MSYTTYGWGLVGPADIWVVGDIRIWEGLEEVEATSVIFFLSTDLILNFLSRLFLVCVGGSVSEDLLIAEKDHFESPAYGQALSGSKSNCT